MPQKLYRAYEAVIQSLIDHTQATAAVLVLADGATEAPHIVVQVGRMSAAGWAEQLKTQPPDVFIQPLTSKGDSTALLVVYAAGRPRWTPLQKSLIETAASSIERLTQSGQSEIDWKQITASHRILPVTEEELCRIVLDIHDGPVQKIYSALGYVSHLQHIIEKNLQVETETVVPDSFSSCHADLNRVADLLEASLSEIRNFLGVFRPPEFAKRPLIDVLEGLIMEHEAVTETTVHFNVEGDLPEVGTPVKIALYRILQESLSNGVRHAGVDEHFVSLWTHQDHLHMEVIDFGNGFEPPTLSGPTATERGEHIGLRGMRDRAQLVGGTFELTSRAGQGTRINVRVPYYE